eukprot:942346-Rhodomonas_salina.2
MVAIDPGYLCQSGQRRHPQARLQTALDWCPLGCAGERGACLLPLFSGAMEFTGVVGIQGHGKSTGRRNLTLRLLNGVTDRRSGFDTHCDAPIMSSSSVCLGEMPGPDA